MKKGKKGKKENTADTQLSLLCLFAIQDAGH